MTSASAGVDYKASATLLPTYKYDSEARIDLYVQPKYPTRTQSDTVGVATSIAFPINTTYSIIDNITNETIIPHDTTCTLIACSGSHWCDVDMAMLFPERYYKLQNKVPDLLFTGSEQYYDIPTLFRVTK